MVDAGDLIPIVLKLRLAGLTQSKNISDILLRLEQFYGGFDEMNLVCAIKEEICNSILEPSNDDDVSVAKYTQRKGLDSLKRKWLDLLNGITTSLSEERILEMMSSWQPKKMKRGAYLSFNFDDIPDLVNIQEIIDGIGGNEAVQLLLSMELDDLLDHFLWPELVLAIKSRLDRQENDPLLLIHAVLYRLIMFFPNKQCLDVIILAIEHVVSLVPLESITKTLRRSCLLLFSCALDRCSTIVADNLCSDDVDTLLVWVFQALISEVGAERLPFVQLLCGDIPLLGQKFARVLRACHPSTVLVHAIHSGALHVLSEAVQHAEPLSLLPPQLQRYHLELAVVWVAVVEPHIHLRIIHDSVTPRTALLARVSMERRHDQQPKLTPLAGSNKRFSAVAGEKPLTMMTIFEKAPHGASAALLPVLHRIIEWVAVDASECAPLLVIDIFRLAANLAGSGNDVSSLMLRAWRQAITSRNSDVEQVADALVLCVRNTQASQLAPLSIVLSEIAYVSGCGTCWYALFLSLRSAAFCAWMAEEQFRSSLRAAVAVAVNAMKNQPADPSSWRLLVSGLRLPLVVDCLLPDGAVCEDLIGALCAQMHGAYFEANSPSNLALEAAEVLGNVLVQKGVGSLPVSSMKRLVDIFSTEATHADLWYRAETAFSESNSFQPMVALLCRLIRHSEDIARIAWDITVCLSESQLWKRLLSEDRPQLLYLLLGMIASDGEAERHLLLEVSGMLPYVLHLLLAELHRPEAVALTAAFHRKAGSHLLVAEAGEDLCSVVAVQLSNAFNSPVLPSALHVVVPGSEGELQALLRKQGVS